MQFECKLLCFLQSNFDDEVIKWKRKYDLTSRDAWVITVLFVFHIESNCFLKHAIWFFFRLPWQLVRITFACEWKLIWENLFQIVRNSLMYGKCVSDKSAINVLSLSTFQQECTMTFGHNCRPIFFETFYYKIVEIKEIGSGDPTEDFFHEIFSNTTRPPVVTDVVGCLFAVLTRSRLICNME